MLFNSLEFAVFLPIVFLIYWFIGKERLRFQNILLLLASYVFYSWWDWRFLFLLLFISSSNYFIGIQIDKNILKNRRKHWLILGLVINIGTLVVFKYYNFFVDSFIDVIASIGYKLPKASAKIILPLGISFYIFISLSYILDIYKETLKANKDIIEVLLTLSFFPIILAGPIQRPALLLPQITAKREFNYDQITDGLKQIIWGLFVKIVIADNLAFYVNDIFLNYANYAGSILLLGAGLYAIQIYADFSGYSNMAIGIARLFGFSLMRNFAYPYFSRDITQFWQRWHISLTMWFRDYIFLPLTFSITWRLNSEKKYIIKTEMLVYIITSILTWLLTGLWHGANYTFIIWGLIHGFFLIIYQIQRKPRKKLFKKLGIDNDNLAVVSVETFITLTIVLFAWIFFRADNLKHAIGYISGIFSASFFTFQKFPYMRIFLVVSFITLIFLFIEWMGRKEQYAIAGLSKKMPVYSRWAVYYLLITIIFFFAGSNQNFIYFQF